MALELVAGRIDPKLNEKLRDYMEENQQTESQVVRDAIALLLDGNLPQPTQLEKRLKRLEAQMRKVQKVAMG